MMTDFRKCLLSTVVGGSLALMALSGTAHAEAFQQSLKPQGPWQVTKVDGLKGNLGYCALAKKYTGDVVLTFARNPNNELTAAIDFQRSVLNPSEKYTVKLDAGGGVSRSFDLKPASNKALVARLGSDPKFIEALAKSGMLNVGMNEQSYSFAMPDMGNGKREMESCVAALGGGNMQGAEALNDIRPASGNGNAPPPPLAPIPAQSSAPADKAIPAAEALLAAPATNAGKSAGKVIETIADAPESIPSAPPAPVRNASERSGPVTVAKVPLPENSPAAVPVAPAGDPQALRDENMRLRAALERERRIFEQNMAAGGENSRTAELAEKVQLLESENAALRAQSSGVPVVPAAPVNDAEIAALNAENAALKKQVAELGAAAQAAASGNAEAASLQTRLSQLQTENANMAKALAQAKAAPQADPALITNLQAQIAQLKAENASVTGALAQAKAAPQPDPALISQLQGQITQLKAENANVASQLAQAKAAPPVDTAAATALATAQKDAANLMAQNAALQGQVTQLQSDHARIAQELAAAKTAVPAVDPAMATSLAAAQGEAAGLRDENIILKKQVELLQAQNTQGASTAQASSDALNALQARIAQLQSENATLAQNLAQAKAAPAVPVVDTAAQTEAATLRNENAALKSQVQALQAQVQSVSAAAASAAASVSQPPVVDGNKDATVARLQARIEELQTENTRLASSLTEVKATPAAATGTITLAQLRSLEAQLRGVEADRDRLVRQLEDIRTGKSDKLMSISAANWDLEQATRRYNEAEREIQRLSRQVEADRLACAKEKKEIEYMLFDPKIATQEQIARITEAENNLLIAESKLAQSSGDPVKIEAAYSERFATLDKQLGEKMTAIKQREQELAALNGRLGAMQQDMAAQKAELDKVRQAVAVKSGTLATVDANIQKQSAEQQQRLAAAEKALAEKQRQLAEVAAAKAAVSIEPAAGSELPVGEALRQASMTPMIPNLPDEPKTAAGRALEELREDEGGEEMTATYIPPGAATPAATAPAPAPVQAAAIPAQPAGNYANAAVLENMLSKAGVQLSRKVQKVEGSAAGIVSHNWETGVLYGSAEQKPIEGPAAFDAFVTQYVKKTESRCQGDFAAIPGKDSGTKGTGARSASYEIACVAKDGGGATASLLFYAQDGVFTTIAHEAAVDGMDAAMDARDRIAGTLGTAKLASAQ